MKIIDHRELSDPRESFVSLCGNHLKKLVFFPLSLLALSSPEMESMLFQSDKIAKAYAPLVAKAPPPSSTPQTEMLLAYASNWFSIDLKNLETGGKPALAYLADPSLWEALAEIGIEAVELKGLKSLQPQVKFQIDPQWGTESDYAKVVDAASKKEIHLIGKMLGNVTGRGADFALGLQNLGAYPELYAMVEIDPTDWSLLPEVKERSLATNVPWLTVQKLHKLGYVPTNFAPYVKQSAWNVTAPILGIDQKTRRWIYLRDEAGFPYLNWLNPSFGALRLAAADSLYSILRLSQPILELENLPENTEETLALTIRKLGGFSATVSKEGITSLKGCTDVSFDHLMPMATWHAVISQDAEALYLLYNLLFKHSIPSKRLVHALEPFGRLPNDWAEFVHCPTQKHVYHAEEMTAEVLRKRLLQEDTLRIEGKKNDPCTWRSLSTTTERGQLLALHLTLARFFALQPGVFSLAPEDLLGVMKEDAKIDLLGFNADCLYSCAKNQLLNPKSFASELKKILRIRKELSLEKAEAVETIPSEHKGVFLMKIRLPHNRRIALLAINFSKETRTEPLESFEYAHATAIDPMTGLSENKPFDSSFFSLTINPLSTKFIVFQPKHYQPK